MNFKMKNILILILFSSFSLWSQSEIGSINGKYLSKGRYNLTLTNGTATISGDEVELTYQAPTKARASFNQEGTSDQTTASTSYGNIPAGWTGHNTGTLVDFTHSAGALTYTGATAKDFQYHCNLTIRTTDIANVIYLAASDNGTVLTNQEMWNTSSGANRPFYISIFGEVNLANGEVFRPVIRGGATTFDHFVEAVGCRLEELD